jgi:hypothetical protein
MQKLSDLIQMAGYINFKLHFVTKEYLKPLQKDWYRNKKEYTHEILSNFNAAQLYH